MIQIPFTLLYAALNALFFLFLSGVVVYCRYTEQVELGDGGKPKLLRAIRVHGNAAEYIPIVLVLLLLLELSGASTLLLNFIGISLLGGRIFHAYGLWSKVGPNFARFVGTNLTWLSLATGAIACLLTFLKK